MRNRLARGTAIVLPAVLLAGMIALGAAGVAASVEDPCAQPTVVASSDPTAGVSPDPTPVPTVDPTPVPTIDPTPVPTVDPTPVPTVDPTPAAPPGPQVRSQVMAPLPAETLPAETQPAETQPAETLPADPTASPCPDQTGAPMVMALVGAMASVLTVVPDAHALVYGAAVPEYTYTLADSTVSPPAPVDPVTLEELGLDPAVLAGYVAPTCFTEHVVVLPPATSEGAETPVTKQYTVTTSVSESPLAVTCTGGVLAGYSFDTTATAELTIAKATTSVVTSPTAAVISYGQTLHDAVLTGGSGSVPGYFTFPPDSWSYTPQVGTQSHVVAFVPDQFADYEPIATPVNVTVTQAAAVVITPPTASALVTGQTLAASILTGGVASTVGTFAFTSPATAPGDGTAAQQVTFTPSDLTSFTPTTVDVRVTVAPAPLDYTTTGYLGRVQMGDVTNMIRPRVMVPLAFTVANGATAITDVTKVKFDPVAISCEAIIDQPSEVFPSVTIGQESSLVYDAAGGRFVQLWEVPATRNTCYRVTTTIDDTVDDTIVAYFKTW